MQNTTTCETLKDELDDNTTAISREDAWVCKYCNVVVNANAHCPKCGRAHIVEITCDEAIERFNNGLLVFEVANGWTDAPIIDISTIEDNGDEYDGYGYHDYADENAKRIFDSLDEDTKAYLFAYLVNENSQNF